MRKVPIRGFSLIEILLALMLFSLLMVAAFQLFWGVLEVSERGHQQIEERQELQLASAILFQDMLHLRDRPHRDVRGGRQPALETTQHQLLRFVRGGLPPVAGVAPGGLQRVAYVLKNKRLYRASWAVLDLGYDSEPQLQLMLRDVDSVELRFLDQNNRETAHWPPWGRDEDQAAKLQSGLPRMLSFRIRFSDGRELQRTFPGVGA